MHGVDDVGDLIGGRHQPAPALLSKKSRTNARTPPPPPLNFLNPCSLHLPSGM